MGKDYTCHIVLYPLDLEMVHQACTLPMLLNSAWKHPVGGPRISLAGGRVVVAEDTQQEIKLKQRGAWLEEEHPSLRQWSFHPKRALKKGVSKSQLGAIGVWLSCRC